MSSGIGHDGVATQLERLGGVALPMEGDLGGPEQHLRLARRRGAAVGLLLHQHHELGPAVGPGEESGQRVAGGPVLGRLLDRVLVGLLGAAVIAEALVLQLADAQRQDRRRFAGGRGFELLLQHADELVPMPGRVVDAAERAYDVEVPGVFAQDLEVELPRAARVGDLSLGDLARVGQQRELLLLVGRHPRLALEVVDQLGPAALPFVDPAERHRHVARAGLFVLESLEDRGRGPGLTQMRLQHVGDAFLNRGAAGRVGGFVGFGGEHRHQAVPLLAGGEEPVQRSRGRAKAGPDSMRLFVDLDRFVVVAQPALGALGQPDQDVVAAREILFGVGLLT